MFLFKLPDIGEGVVEAELTRWHVRAGDTVTENQVLAELLTDKAAIEIPSPRAGRIATLCCKEGEIIRVGAVLIEIEENSGPVAAGSPAVAAAPGTAGTGQPAAKVVPSLAVAAAVAPVSPIAVAAAGSLPPPRPRAHALPIEAPASAPIAPADAQAVPAVREYARAQGVDLNSVVGSGPGGRIMRRDIDARLAAVAATAAEPPGARPSARVPREPSVGSAAAPAPAIAADPADWQRRPLRGLRRTIAERMVQSKFSAPHYTYVEEIDMTRLEEGRARWQKRLNEEFSPLVFIARAIVRTLPNFPEMNASLDADRQEVIVKGRIHLGLAAAVDDGLLVPVIRDAAHLSTRELAAAMRLLKQRARQGELTPAELKGSTFTISSLGKLGGVVATPILNPPEVAIVAVNAIRTLPRYLPPASVGESQLEPRQIMNLSMSLDHRVIDGAVCARFVAAVKAILEAADFPDLSGTGAI